MLDYKKILERQIIRLQCEMTMEPMIVTNSKRIDDCDAIIANDGKKSSVIM